MELEGFKLIEIGGRQAWLSVDGDVVPRIAGGDGDGELAPAPAATVDGGNVPVTGPEHDDTSPPAPPAAEPLPAEPAPAEEEPIVEFGGEQFTATQVQEALQLQRNNTDFVTKNQQEAARLNTLAKVLEEYRQGPINPPVEAPSALPANLVSADDAVKFQNALLSDNPSEAIAQLVNFVKSTVSAQTSEQQAENAFMTAHPDYTSVVNSAEYATFKAQSPLGPYLNDVNGYYEFKASTAGTALAAAEAAGVRQGEQQANAHATAKARLTVLNGSNGVTPPARAPITPDTAHGDVLNAATAFLTQRRQAQ